MKKKKKSSPSPKTREVGNNQLRKRQFIHETQKDPPQLKQHQTIKSIKPRNQINERNARIIREKKSNSLDHIIGFS